MKEKLSEDERLIADLNDTGLDEAFAIMRELNRRRRLQGMSEHAVAEAMGTKQSAVNEMTRCDPMPGLVVAARFAAAVGARIGVVVPEDEAYSNRQFNYPSPESIIIIKRMPRS